MSNSVLAGDDAPTGLAGVLPAAFAAVRGESNAFALPAVPSAVVVLVDGLGALQLRANAGHARRLMRGGRASIRTVFPTTTVAAVASLTTGASPGRHGLAGYRLVDPETDRVVEHLSGWLGDPDPRRWQSLPTVFDAVTAAGLAAYAVGPERFRASSFTTAVLRGAEYVGEDDLGQRFAVAADLAGVPGRVVYVYVPELDTAGHKHGVDSDAWRAELERIDDAVRVIASSSAGVLVTADHGMVDVPPEGHRFYDVDPALLAGVRHAVGEPRGLQLHVDADALDDLLVAWRRWVRREATVLSRDELVASGWLGEVDARVLGRLGDVIVVARRAVAYYDSRTAGDSVRMVGQHGAATDAESLVPLLRLGAFGG